MKITFSKPVLDLSATGAKIKSLLRQRGISPRQLQVILSFPYVQTIYNWFSGKNMPSLDNLVVLAQILDVRIDEIIVTKTVNVEIDDEEDGEVLIA